MTNPIRFGGVTPRPHRHRWTTRHFWDHTDIVCQDCGKVQDETTRRGRTAGRAGKDGERMVAKDAGPEWKRVGQFGSPVDVEAPWAVGQVKTGGRYSMGDEKDLDGMTAYAAGRLKLLFKVNRPGPGRPKRVTVTMRVSDFLAEFGDGLVVLDMPDWSAWKKGEDQ